MRNKNLLFVEREYQKHKKSRDEKYQETQYVLDKLKSQVEILLFTVQNTKSLEQDSQEYILDELEAILLKSREIGETVRQEIKRRFSESVYKNKV
jgi:hypothetical protein